MYFWLKEKARVRALFRLVFVHGSEALGRIQALNFEDNDTAKELGDAITEPTRRAANDLQTARTVTHPDFEPAKQRRAREIGRVGLNCRRHGRFRPRRVGCKLLRFEELAELAGSPELDQVAGFPELAEVAGLAGLPELGEVLGFQIWVIA